ncbi:MAG: c-type cytochrome [Chitinophagaceae bacterium]|nr:c-type cytochrome [Chitinophagaceae bacterium]
MKSIKFLMLLSLMMAAFSFTSIAQPALIAAKTRGKIVYTTYCMPCHQADGNGVPNLNPPLVKTSYVLGDKTKLIGIVLNGLNQEIEINGETYNGVMASHDYLTNQEIADVLTYVRNSFGNKAALITPQDVKLARVAFKK